MGTYFYWVNLDKKEFLSAQGFGECPKLWSTTYYKSKVLGAIYSLLSDEWKGDSVIRLGDEIDVPEDDDGPLLRRLRDEAYMITGNYYVFDYVYEHYKRIDCLFKLSEPFVKENIFNDKGELRDTFFLHQYRITDKENPLRGLFVKDIKFFRYTVNHTKKEFYDIKRIVSRWPYKYSLEVNPLSILMTYPRDCNDYTIGYWIGDEIEVTDKRPTREYKNMSKEYTLDI